MVSWEELENACQHCRACPLAETRTNVVFGVGSHQADILFIGEGPGEQEDLQGEPFVGPAGKLLDLMLSLIDLERSNVYIANIVKCRPPKNRDPLNTEQDACIGYLRAQTALLRPKIIVCLGRIAAMRIIDKDFRITRQHGLVPPRRRGDDCDLPPLCRPAGPVEGARHLRRPEKHPGQGQRTLPGQPDSPGPLRPHRAQKVTPSPQDILP